MAKTQRQRQQSAINGRAGGRPKHGSGALQRVRAQARKIGENATLRGIRYLVALLDGLIPEATPGDRLRATENILDRFGYPRLAQTQQQVEFPAKLFDMTGFDANGSPLNANGHDTSPPPVITHDPIRPEGPPPEQAH